MLNILQPWIQIRRFIRLTVFQFLSSVHFQDRNSCCVCHRWFRNVSSQIRSNDRVRPEAAFLTVHWAGSQPRVESTLFLHYFDKILTKKHKKKRLDLVTTSSLLAERSVDMRSGEKAINLVFPVIVDLNLSSSRLMWAGEDIFHIAEKQLENTSRFHTSTSRFFRCRQQSQSKSVFRSVTVAWRRGRKSLRLLRKTRQYNV